MLTILSAITPRPTPALHSDEVLVTAPVEAMSAFDHADAPLTISGRCGTSGLLLAFAFGAFGRAVGNVDPPNSFRFGRRLVLIGKERCVGRDQARQSQFRSTLQFSSRQPILYKRPELSILRREVD
jgi:hypothetical protein